MPSDIEIALLSSNGLLREGLRHIFTDQGFEIACATGDPGAIRFTQYSGDEHAARIIIIDDVSLNANAELYDALRDRHPDVRLVVLADCFDFDAVVSSFRHGADGYLVKEISSEPLIGALRLVALGEKVFPSELATCMGENPCQLACSVDLSEVDLSVREIEVLRLLIVGSANKVIGRHLGICEATVKVHVKGALRKLRVANRTQAAIWAMEHGLSGYEAAIGVNGTRSAAIRVGDITGLPVRSTVVNGASCPPAPAMLA